MEDYNPFVTDVPLPASELIDRDTEWRRMVDLARGGHNSRLSAPRRYGKTTLLRKVLEEAARSGLTTAYVDLYGVLSIEETAVRIAAAYREGLEGRLGSWFAGVLGRLRIRASVGVSSTSLQVEPRSAEGSMETLHELLDLPRRLHERTERLTLVVFDEFQDILKGATNADAVIRSRIQHHQHASYAFAGSHPGLMAELFESRDRPLYGQARPLELQPLDDEDLADYVGRRFADSDRDPGRALAPLLELVRGHPQRAMLAAHHLWEATAPGEQADEEHWANASSAMMLEVEEMFERMWSSFSINEQRVLAALAAAARGGRSFYAAETLARFRLSKSTATDVRSALTRSGEVRKARGEHRIVDPLLEAWIAAGRRSP